MDNSSALDVAVVGGIIVAVVLGIGLYVWVAAALAAVFSKLGHQRWRGWVPIVNSITLLESGGYSPLWVITLFLPGVNIVGLVILLLAVNNINYRFGKGAGFTALWLFLSPIWASILGFGRARPIDDEPDVAPPPFVPSGPPVTWGGPPTPSSELPVLPTPTPHSGLAAPFALVSPALSAPQQPIVAVPLADTVAINVAAPAAPLADPPVAVPTPVAPPASPVSFLPAAPAVPPTPVPRADYADRVAPFLDDFAEPRVVPPVARAASADADVIDGATIITGRTTFFEQDEPDDVDETIISARRVKPWIFETHDGQKVSLTNPVVLLGRNPSRAQTHPDAQLVSVIDAGKTVSKTHARIELAGGTWSITDLHSTNGVVLKTAGGEENELPAGTSAVLTEEFYLGELSARIYLES